PMVDKKQDNGPDQGRNKPSRPQAGGMSRSPAKYSPQVKREKEPATPIPIVMRQPPGSFPGTMSFAIAPTISPIIKVPRRLNMDKLLRFGISIEVCRESIGNERRKSNRKNRIGIFFLCCHLLIRSNFSPPSKWPAAEAVALFGVLFGRFL